MAKYKCPTLGDCDKANAGEVFDVMPGEDTKCPTCATQLELVPVAVPGGRMPKALIGIVAAVVVVCGGAGYAYVKHKAAVVPADVAAVPTEVAAAPAPAKATTPNGMAPSDAETAALRRQSEAGLVAGASKQAEDDGSRAVANEMMKVAIAKMAQGKLDEAEKELNDAQARAPRQPLVYYNLAILRLKQARTDEALKQFEAAFMAGFDNFKEMDADTDLDGLRKDPRFVDLVNKYRMGHA